MLHSLFLTPFIGLHLYAEACTVCGIREMTGIKSSCGGLSSIKVGRYLYERKSLVILIKTN